MYMVLGLPAPIFMAVGALGVRSGRRQRLTRYLAFILNLLPEGTRQTVVEIAKDEAIQISQTRGADGCDFLHGSVSGQLSTIAEHPVDAR
jgi:hypothetical protein